MKKTETFAARLDRLRMVRGLSMTALAHETGISRSALYRLYEGRPDRILKGCVETYARLARALGVTIDELLSGHIRL